jgi:cob(I)alamin adenosyltransferase
MAKEKRCMTKDKAPRKHEGIKDFVKKGLILVNTGDGKGKSTAAFGTAIRSMGRGYNVAIVQFIKGNWKTGEGEFFARFKDQCDVFVMGEGFTWDTKNFDQDVATAKRAWEKCKEILHNPRYHLVIFDEINYVMKYNFIDVKDVVAALKKKPALKHVILTGGGAPKKLIAIADLVTEMKLIKHPYYKGIKAQPGIEY